MRIHFLPADAFICLCLSMLVSLGTGWIAGHVAKIVYEKQLEEHQAVDGEIGGRAGETAFRARNIKDLLSHDTFTIVSHGIQYRNEGAGYYGNCYLYNVALPSGERVAARVNDNSVQTIIGSFYSGTNILPLGQIVWEDLTQDQTFLNQIESGKPLSRKDFYVDMVGNTAVMAEDQALEIPKIATQVLTVLILYPVFHTIGSRLGIFLPYFYFTKKKKDTAK